MLSTIPTESKDDWAGQGVREEASVMPRSTGGAAQLLGSKPSPAVHSVSGPPESLAAGSLRLGFARRTSPAKTGDSAEQLVLNFLGIADALSRRYYALGCDAEDLQQVARLGLVKAAKGFCESKGYGFMAYAVPTINGELKRYVRDHSWVVRPPRPMQEARLKMRQARQELLQSSGHYPSAAELAHVTGLSVVEIGNALLAETAMVAHQIEGNDSPRDYRGSWQNTVLAMEDLGFERIEQEHSLESALSDASHADRRLLYLRFDRELSQEQIAKEFGVSQMQISRLLNQLLDRIKRRLTEPGLST